MIARHGKADFTATLSHTFSAGTLLDLEIQIRTLLLFIPIAGVGMGLIGIKYRDFFLGDPVERRAAYLTTRCESMPLTIGPWLGTDAPIREHPLRDTGMPAVIFRTYIHSRTRE